MKKLIFTLALFLSFISFQTFAVINNSTYQMTLRTSVNLVTGSKTTIIGQNQSNVVSNIIALPFNFRLDGTNYTHFGACSDGWIKLGTSNTMTITANSSNDLTNSNDRPKIAPFWDRMNIPNVTGQGVHTITNGVSPNRTFTIEWNVAIPRNGAGRGTFQLVLFETSNQIQFIYSGMNGASFYNSYSIGLSGVAANSSSDFASVSTIASGAHTVSYTTVNNGNSATLVNNSSILFTPRATTLSSANTFSNIGRNSFTATWTKGSGSGRLVIARTSASPTAPTNHTVYTANSVYGLGTSITSGSFVVGSGDISTLNVTGLGAATNYCLDIYEYVGSLADGNAVFNTTPFTVCQTTQGPYPTTGPSNAVFSNITRNSLTLSWTNGNGNNRLVVASKDATPNTLITEFLTYNANSSFGLGDAVGNGFVVYNGNGNSFNLTNLSGASTYYFHVYEYNNLSNELYYAINLRLSANATTLSNYPTTGPSNAVFSNITTNALTLSWTNGNGNNRLVVASKDANPNTLITDLTAYTANASYGQGTAVGNGFVVYNGSGNSFNLTNLTGASTYYFHVYEYNNFSNQLYYAINLRLSANATTLNPYPTTGPSNAVFSNITTNALTLSWTNGNGNNRLVVASKDTNPSTLITDLTAYTANASYGQGTAVGNGFVVYNGSGNSFNLTNLTGSSKYFFHVYEYNNISNQLFYAINLRLSANATTLNPYPTTGPSNAVFSNITTNALTLTWTNGNGNNRLVIASIDTNPSTLITDLTAYTANASYGQGTAVGNGFVVYNGNGNSVNLTNLTAASKYFFHVYEYNNISNQLFYAINLRLSASESTLIPTPTAGASNIIFTAIGQNNITLSWTKGDGAKRIVLARNAANPDVDPSDRSTYSANAVFGNGAALGNAFVVYDGNGNSVNVTGLNPATYYHFSVIEYNEVGNNKYFASTLKTTSNCSTLQPDADNDGVTDSEDEYPNNQYKAYNTRYPAAGFGTLMFEDLWPGKGDYDFNDLVLDYNYNVTSNANNEVVEVKYTFVTRAIGGALHNGFAFQLDGIPSNRILSVSGSKAVGATWAAFNGNGTEAGQTNTNILVLKDAYDLLPVSGGYSFVNVDPQAPFVGTDTTVIIVKFSDGNTWASEDKTSITSFTSAIFNPYLIVGQDRGKEIHLPNRVPTSLVNPTYFGMFQDDSNPAEGRYYKTKNELPWVLNVNQSIPYPTERTDFTDAYLKFFNWASSNGSSDFDWYLNKENYRDNSKIYKK